MPPVDSPSPCRGCSFLFGLGAACPVPYDFFLVPPSPGHVEGRLADTTSGGLPLFPIPSSFGFFHIFVERKESRFLCEAPPSDFEHRFPHHHLKKFWGTAFPVPRVFPGDPSLFPMFLLIIMATLLRGLAAEGGRAFAVFIVRWWRVSEPLLLCLFSFPSVTCHSYSLSPSMRFTLSDPFLITFPPSYPVFSRPSGSFSSWPAQ